ncbi:hypothetical protein ES708_15442 [subsurface metagenome]
METSTYLFSTFKKLFAGYFRPIFFPHVNFFRCFFKIPGSKLKCLKVRDTLRKGNALSHRIAEAIAGIYFSCFCREEKVDKFLCTFRMGSALNNGN